LRKCADPWQGKSILPNKTLLPAASSGFIGFFNTIQHYEFKDEIFFWDFGSDLAKSLDGKELIIFSKGFRY